MALITPVFVLFFLGGRATEFAVPSCFRFHFLQNLLKYPCQDTTAAAAEAGRNALVSKQWSIPLLRDSNFLWNPCSSFSLSTESQNLSLFLNMGSEKTKKNKKTSKV